MSFLDNIHPERAVTGSSKLDGTLKFYSFVKTIMCELQAQRVMDFGAGRGAPLLRETRRWRKDLLDLRQHGAEVYACDIDPAVKSHQWSDHQVVLDARSIPFEDEFFDMIVSDVTFEHIREPERVAAELVRVLRPGGFICARTPNRYGYPKFFASLVPNKLHARVLSYVQPRGRQEADIFPTAFQMNSVRRIRNLFKGCDVHWYRESGEPAYYFGSPILYRLLLAFHKILPDALSTSLCLFIRKRDHADVSATRAKDSLLPPL